MIDRRRFLGLGFRACALAALARMTRGYAFAQTAQTGSQEPIVLEVIRRGFPVSAGLDFPEAGVLLDELLTPLTGLEEEFILDIWSELFPDNQTAGVKIDASRPGRITVTVARALAGRASAAGVPADHVILWDRDGDALARAGLKVSTKGSPRVLSIAASGGYGRPVRAARQAPAPGMALARLAERITRHATVTSLAALPDGTMAPFVFENVAGAAGRRGKGPRASGIEAARVASDPALAPRTVLHVADLWNIPLGNDAEGRPRSWEAGTVLVSRDPVAMTRVAHRILANTRRALALGETPEPPSLAEAARLGLGEQSLDKIIWQKLSF